jgi:phosphohistidine phosphatase
MIRLLLLRHAKSSWEEQDRGDRDRQLSDRGKEAATMIGAYMRKMRLIPDLVLCSPATRAVDTWELVLDQVRSAPEVLSDEAVYDFGDGSRLLDSLRSKGGKAKTVLIVGHNPSIERLAQSLIGSGSDKLRAKLVKKYPTGALTVIDFTASDWKSLKGSDGRLLSFTRPKDLSPN